MKNDSALWQCPACETLNEGGEVCAACGLSRAEADELLRRQSARPGSRKQQNGQNQQSGRNPQNAQPTGRNQQPAPAKKKNGLVAVLAVALVASLAVGGFFAWKAFGSGDGDTDGGRKEKTESTAEQTGGDEANSTDGDRAENPTEPPAETPAPQVEGDWNWSLENGVLTISGTGNMKKFQFAEAPWYGREEEIQSIVIESGVTGVGNWAFYYCDSLTSVTIPDSVTSIGDYAFWGCHSLTSVTIPDGMTIIGTGAFGGCRSLQQVQVSEGNRSFCSIDGVLFSRGRKTILCYPGGRAGAAYAVPDDVTGIGDRAFDCCYGLTSITIPDSVTSIGEVAFHECRGLTSVTIPDSVTSIGDYAFDGCRGLTSVTIPDSVTSIGEGAFGNCDSLQQIRVSEGNLSFRSIDGVLFSNDRKTLLCCPGGRAGAAYAVPDGVTSIGNWAFDMCRGLTSVTIPDSVTSIGDYAFDGCRGLTSVTIPDSVTSIGDWAFNGCDNLTTVYFGGSAEQWQKISVGDRNAPLLNAEIRFK